ncbi:type II toxin-antitoxin system YafQ family toxin [Polaribacter litorisediminis]|uniref:type II toxin-antitoxin system YafQ family toxin n=1 Tax=Polaribacter litorisediminis TaxID=1908341 RepID=UPI001CBFC3DC|nr:type II toxin-antitoxin system YafQ family toxin [Polaribacter litorisediminis]UAM98532.1 type II toxin-antitoxin system YafQ family toxin [Polaribacter litorisediminis]
MYILKESTQFKKDLKKLSKKSLADLNITFEVLEILQISGAVGIPKEMKPHKLRGNYKNNWECHMKPDLLIIWFQIEENFTIKLVRIGSHSELFT